MKETLLSIMEKLCFPEDAKLDLLDAFCMIEADTDALRGFQNVLKRYDDSEKCNYMEILDDVMKIGEGVGVHKYTASLLLYLLMAPKLLERYRDRGYPEEIYVASLMDLRYKLEECRLVYGINGSFVGYWFRRFFDLTRFALGRLQFEMIETKEPFLLNEELIPEGSAVINVHIPRTGTRLFHEEVMKSYELASEWFAKEFENKQILFYCKSHLLDPWMQTVLSPSSNLVQFIRDFEIVKSGQYDDYSEVWRVFDCNYEGDVSKLPQESSLRRAYAERIKLGEKIGWGIGIFSYKKK